MRSLIRNFKSLEQKHLYTFKPITTIEMNQMITDAQQTAQDLIHDLVRESLESIKDITYCDISAAESRKLAGEVGNNLKYIDGLRIKC